MSSGDTVHFEIDSSNFGNPNFTEYTGGVPSSVFGSPVRIEDPEERLTIPDPSHPAFGKLRLTIECIVQSELDSPFCLRYAPRRAAWVWGLVLGITALFLTVLLTCMCMRIKRRAKRAGAYVVETADLQTIGDANAGKRRAARNKKIKAMKKKGTNFEMKKFFSFGGEKVSRQRWAGMMMFGKAKKYGDMAEQHEHDSDDILRHVSMDSMGGSDSHQLRKRLFQKSKNNAVPHARAFGDAAELDLFGGGTANKDVAGNWIPFLDPRLLAVGLKEKELFELRNLDFDNLLEMLDQSRSIKYEWKDMSCTLDALMLAMRAARCRVSSTRLGWISWVVKPRGDSNISLCAIYAAHVMLQEQKTFDELLRIIREDLDETRLDVSDNLYAF